MTTIPPHGLEILGPRRERDPGRVPVLWRHAALRLTQTEKARQRKGRGVSVNVELLLFLAVTAALIGAVLP